MRWPRHVGIAMDGNGRWATERGLTRSEGHTAGERPFVEAVEGAIELGVPWLSIYAFSTENWRRAPDEVRHLLSMARDVLRTRRNFFLDRGIRVRWAGRRPRLWTSVITELERTQELSVHGTNLDLVLCVNYGGTRELVDAATAIATHVAAGRLTVAEITEDTVRRHLYQPDAPDVDLFIRTSGEQRLSNFYLWQTSYAELDFIDVYWPEFTREHLRAACERYAR